MKVCDYPGCGVKLYHMQPSSEVHCYVNGYTVIGANNQRTTIELCQDHYVAVVQRCSDFISSLENEFNIREVP